MPLGWERINFKKTTPNKNIVFLKPLPGKYENVSKDFLERIAAQCLPVMNNHSLAVVSLEEYEPNLEFWGRNFNNGEVIQLVLRSPSTGQWLPFKFVQMVMMHELAHNKQMNHSAAFHKVRIEFTNEMKALWEKGYTGDGLWGRGVLLENGAFAREELGGGEILPEHLCGGTFKSRGGRKRKVRPKITYKEQRERRIKKKFGTNGVALGADEDVKAKLEKGKKVAGKPRVAGSARGRELRAAAALARFEAPKEEPQLKDEDLVTDSETESDVDGDVFIKTEPDDAIDIDGSRLFDRDGLPLLKVCEDEDKDDENAKNELLELQKFDGKARRSQLSKETPKPQPATSKSAKSTPSLEQPKKLLGQGTADSTVNNSEKKDEAIAEEDISTGSEDEGDRRAVEKATKINCGKEKELDISKPRARLVEGPCLVCSMENEPTALTCMACSHVLKPDFVPNSWRCSTTPCSGSEYINSGDMGICGVCGTRKCS